MASEGFWGAQRGGLFLVPPGAGETGVEAFCLWRGEVSEMGVDGGGQMLFTILSASDGVHGSSLRSSGVRRFEGSVGMVWKPLVLSVGILMKDAVWWDMVMELVS